MRSDRRLTFMHSVILIALALLMALGATWGGASAAPIPFQSPVGAGNASLPPQVINPPPPGAGPGLPTQTGILIVVLLLLIVQIIGQSLRPSVPPQYVPPPSPEHHSTEHPPTEHH